MPTPFALFAALALTLAGVASAAADGARCAGPTAAAPATATRLLAALQDMGYRILETETEHRCLVVHAVNHSGFPVELTYEPTSGELIRAALD